MNDNTKTLFYILGLQFLNILLPFVGLIGTWIIWNSKKDADPIIMDQGKESMNFQITFLIAYVIAAALKTIWIGKPVFAALIVLIFVVTIIGASKNIKNEIYIYPFSLRFIK